MNRIHRVLDRLSHHSLDAAALTGGVASLWHAERLGIDLRTKAPHDVDLVVSSFGAIPRSLGGEFLCSHIHPSALRGRIWLQLVDPVEAMRIDIFGERGAALERCETRRIGGAAWRIMALEDLVAANARFLLDLGRGKPVPRKHRADFRATASRD